MKVREKIRVREEAFEKERKERKINLFCPLLESRAFVASGSMGVITATAESHFLFHL